MSYAKMRREETERGNFQALNVKIIRWVEPGEEVCGKLVKCDTWMAEDPKDSCIQYIIDTDYGVASFMLGSGRDELYKSSLYPGVGVYIRYDGKHTGKDKKIYNNFYIETFIIKKVKSEE